LPSALTSGVPYAPRFIPVLIPLSMLIAYGLERVLEILSKQRPLSRRSIYSIILILFIYQFTYFFHVYFVHFKTTSLPEFPSAPVVLGQDIKNIRITNPDTEIYFLGGKSCRSWGHDDLQLWYFADLPNKDMIKWDNLFRQKRYASKYSPFDAYDNITQPRFAFSDIVMNPSEDEIDMSLPGSVIIRCGLYLPTIDRTKEQVKKVYYMYESTKQDPYYVMTKKI